MVIRSISRSFAGLVLEMLVFVSYGLFMNHIHIYDFDLSQMGVSVYGFWAELVPSQAQK